MIKVPPLFPACPVLAVGRSVDSPQSLPLTLWPPDPSAGHLQLCNASKPQPRAQYVPPYPQTIIPSLIHPSSPVFYNAEAKELSYMGRHIMYKCGVHDDVAPVHASRTLHRHTASRTQHRAPWAHRIVHHGHTASCTMGTQHHAPWAHSIVHHGHTASCTMGTPHRASWAHSIACA